MEIWSGRRGDVGVTVRLDRVVYSLKAREAFWSAPYRNREDQKNSAAPAVTREAEEDWGR